ncbi:unnamed protein product [Prunus armeniaca]
MPRDQESNVGSSAIALSLVPHVPSIARLLSAVSYCSVQRRRLSGTVLASGTESLNLSFQIDTVPRLGTLDPYRNS